MALSTDRQRGALLGLAIGDALGAPIEFSRPGTFEPVVDFRAGGPFQLEAGQWTDDTSMALALADSLAEAGWDLNDQARRYVKWWQEGVYSITGECFDIGNTTVASLERFRRTGDVRASADRSEHASGNGCLMRLAPAPIRYARLFPHDVAELARLAGESSVTTHGSSMCVSACRYFALLLAGLMHGESRDEVLSPDWEPLARLQSHFPLDPRVEAIARGSFRDKQPPAIRGSGFVIDSLEASLWAFHDAPDYATAVLKAVNLGHDTDTTGAICGQLAGACWGESGIPERWRERVAGREMLEQALARLLA